jgi:hypothetical protein
MTEGNDQSSTTQDTNEGNQGPQQPQVPAGYVPLTERDSAAAAARRDGEASGKSAAEKALLERYGVSSFDDLDAAVKAARDRADAEKTAQDRLADRENDLKAARDDAKAQKERADRYETVLNTYLEKEREGLPKHILAALDAMNDVPAQLDYIAEYRSDFVAPQESETNANSQRRRAPDTTPRINVDENVRGRERLSLAFGQKYG